MRSSFIAKIEKASIYAQQPERVTFSSFSVDFHGENNIHKVAYQDGKWHCSCHFFSQWGICSHIMALQQMLSKMLPQEALSSPILEPMQH